MYDDLVILNDFYISGEADKQEIEKESNKLLKKLERIEFQKMLSELLILTIKYPRETFLRLFQSLRTIKIK